MNGAIYQGNPAGQYYLPQGDLGNVRAELMRRGAMDLIPFAQPYWNVDQAIRTQERLRQEPRSPDQRSSSGLSAILAALASGGSPNGSMTASNPTVAAMTAQPSRDPRQLALQALMG